MSDSSPLSAPKKNYRLPIIIAAVLLAVMAAGLFISRAGLDKAVVKRVLDAGIEKMRERARAEDRDLNVTYSDIEITGGFANKLVIVRNPVLTIKPLHPQPILPGEEKKTDSLVIATPLIELDPQAVDFSSVKINVPQPINFAGADAPEKSLLKITANSPFSVLFATQQANVPTIKINYISPTSIELVYLHEQQAQGTEDATPNIIPVYKTLTVSMEAGAGFESDFTADDAMIGASNVHFKNITITPKDEPAGAIQVAEISATRSKLLNDQQRYLTHATVLFGPITAPAELLPAAPIHLALDVSSDTLAVGVASNPEAESRYELKTFNLTTKDTGINASGSFAANAKEVLPVGTATINITNFPGILERLRTYTLLKPQNEAMVAALAQQITQTPMDQLKDTSVLIERTRGGAFKIGKTTFEELLAVILKQAIHSGDKKPAINGANPATKIPEKPSKPAVLNENSARG